MSGMCGIENQAEGGAISNGSSASQRIDRWQPAGRPPPIRMCEGSAKARSSLPAQGAIRSSSQGRRPWSPGAHAASPNGATVPFAVRTTNRMAGPSALDFGAGRVTRGVAPGWTNGWPFGPEEASTSWPLWAYRCASGQKVNSRCKNLLWPSHPGSVQSDSTGATPAIAGRGACGETCPHDSLLCRGTPVGSKESQPLPSRRIRHQKEAQ